MANENPTPPKSPKWRWLVYNEERLASMPMPGTRNKVTGMIDPDGNVFQLVPGANLVEVKRYEALKANDESAASTAAKGGYEVPPGELTRLLTTKIPRATHRHRQHGEAGKYHLVEGPMVANKSDPLGGLTEQEAIGIVEEIFEIGVLRSLIQIEKRSAVNETLHRCLENLTRGSFTQAVG